MLSCGRPEGSSLGVAMMSLIFSLPLLMKSLACVAAFSIVDLPAAAPSVVSRDSARISTGNGLSGAESTRAVWIVCTRLVSGTMRMSAM